MKIIDLYRYLCSELKLASNNKIEAEAEAYLVFISEKFSTLNGFNLSKESLYGTKRDIEVKNESYNFILEIIKSRKSGMPIQYIINESWFSNLKFEVFLDECRKTLIPRNETELIVNKSIDFISKNDVINALDVGTGSGCIPISILNKIEKDINWIAIDPYLNEIASNNAKKYNMSESIEFKKISIQELQKFKSGKYDLITANLPYVPDTSRIETIVRQEPHEAIFGGRDGLKFIKNLVNALPKILMDNNSIAIFEIDPSQVEYFYSLRDKFKVEIMKDIQSLNRVATLSFK
ncbi:MAG: hypothetical protein CL762_02420 [Chloroflexi bacterium]|nr:hypothetical protein [Chloroflexota bacterium]